MHCITRSSCLRIYNSPPPLSSPLLVVFYAHRPGRRAWLGYRHTHTGTYFSYSAREVAVRLTRTALGFSLVS